MKKIKLHVASIFGVIVAAAIATFFFVSCGTNTSTQKSMLASRITISLDGQWAIEEGIAPDSMPSSFTHTVPVPGLSNQAQPSFPDADQYESREFVWIMGIYGLPIDETGLVNAPIEENWSQRTAPQLPGLGRTRQKRNFFWYQRTFTAPAKKQSAILVVNKAQFGTAVWVNGRKIGEHLGCFTAGRFDVTNAIEWDGPNRIVIRIGAHPGALPEWAHYGGDYEKERWTSGIYDNVSLILADNPQIESVQVAPKIQNSEILIQTKLKNTGPACSTELVQQVKAWKSGQPVGEPVRLKIHLAAGEEKLVTQTIPVPGATLWTPENPHLYTVETKTDGDNCTTRFGMREFRFDTHTRRAYLNGEVCFLRGSSITLHRFFADSLCAGLPWKEEWVRKLLEEIPHKMHWNSFRICIGPVPQKWLDIADEAGLLLQYEYPVWNKKERYKLFKQDLLKEQYKEFLRDNWNHPSVVLWDASNETPEAAEMVQHNWGFLDSTIAEVRKLDLSGRPWDNGYNTPQGSDDPFEQHPYLFTDIWQNEPPFFEMTRLEDVSRRGGTGGSNGYLPHSAHAAIINEYDLFWLHRDGRPTVLSKPVFDRLLGSQATAQQRRELAGYLMGGLTEFWRAYRYYAGVLWLAYLDGDTPHAMTSDFFQDIRQLELEPYFEDYMKEASKPLGVYIAFWQPNLKAGTKRYYQVMMLNDGKQPVAGKLEITWLKEDGKQEGPTISDTFNITSAGQMTYNFEFTSPAIPGEYTLTAKAFSDDQPRNPTISRRKVKIIL